MDRNRKAAYETLFEIETKGAYSNIALNRTIEKMQPDDEAFVRNLVYGVLENLIYIDYKLSKLVSTKLRKLRPQVLVLLRMGAYQIEFMESVPSYAAINESVTIAKKVCRGLDGFVNGVLRNFDRKYQEIQLPDMHKEPARYLSVKYSYQQDIAEMWLEMYEFDAVESLMKAGNAAPPLTIRVNRLKTDIRELRSRLEAQGFNVSEVKTGDESQDKVLSEMALNVSGSGLLSTEWFRKGHFSVQDISSMLAISALDPQPGDVVIDVCGAPGGKSLCAAEMMGNKGRIITCDIHEHKLQLISKTAEKLGADIVEVKQNDGTAVREEFIGIADRVIVDAPCSGLGVVRRKPEIKLHMTKKDIMDLADIQLRILETSASYLKENGVLIYSTCTVSKYENIGVLDAFLKKNKNFFVKAEKQLLPDIDTADGFYFTVLQRF